MTTRIEGYDARYLRTRIAAHYPGIEESAEYKAMEDRLFDYTNACDKQEHNAWMHHYMSKAIRMELEAHRIRNGNSRDGMRHEAAVLYAVAYDMLTW